MNAATVTPPPASRPPTQTATTRPVSYGTDPTTYRFSNDQYDRMVESGILGPDDKLELLEGYLVIKMPPNPPHSAAVRVIAKRVRRHLPAGWEESI